MAENKARRLPDNAALAQARYVRTTPMKVRRVVDLIRGLPAAQAQAVLRFAPQAATEPVGKVLDSAIANAEHNKRLDPTTLVVSEAYVDEGPTLKRFRPRAQGRAYRIRKRTSHITVVVESRVVHAHAGGRPSQKTAGQKTAGQKTTQKPPQKAEQKERTR